MPKIEAAIKEAIARGARREIRRVATPLRGHVRRLRRTIRSLRREVVALRSLAEGWRRAVRQAPATPQVTEEEAQGARLSPRLVRTLRTRLGLSQAKLARLVGVSAMAVTQWESGRSSPSRKHRAAVVALRRLGRREAQRLLAEMPQPQARRVRRTVRTKGRGRTATGDRTRTTQTQHRR